MTSLDERVATIRDAIKNFRSVHDMLVSVEFDRRMRDRQAMTEQERLAADQLRLRAMTEAWRFVDEFTALDAALAAGQRPPAAWSVAAR